MNNSGTIQTSQSADRVTYKVLIDGEEIPGTFQVKSIMVAKEANRIPTATLALIDGDPAERDFKGSNSALFVPGKKIEITSGYHSDEATIFKGVVIKQKLKIRDNQSLLMVEAKDEAVRMTLRRKSKYFYDMSDADMIEELVTSYSLEVDIPSTSTEHPELVQYDVTDWDFIMLRAQANGLIAGVDDGKITFKPPSLSEEEVETITFGSTMLEFDAEMDARTQVPDVISRSWNPTDQVIQQLEGEDPQLTTNGNLSSGDLSGLLDEDQVILTHGGNKKDSSLQDWANAHWTFQQLAKTRGRIKFQGLPEVKPGVLLRLEGVGDRFNGKVYISGVQHQITEGNWTTDAQFGFDPQWFAESTDIHRARAAGLTAAVNGLQVGIVNQLQDDPEGEDRIMVKLPMVNLEEQGIWCRQACLDAGDGRGVAFRPEIGDEVIVGFIQEDPNDAVVLGVLHSSVKPSPIPGADDNHEKGIITREGMKLLFNEEQKSIMIATPAGNKLQLSEEEGGVHLEDEHGNKMVMDSNGITLESVKDLVFKASGDVSIEGVNISAAAQAQFTAEGQAGAELSTSAVAVVKGSLVQIN